MSSAGLPDRSGVGAVAGRKGGGAPFPNQSGDAQPDRAIAPRGCLHVQCARRGQPEERREVAQARDVQRQARAAQNAPKHGMRAQKYVLLPTTAVPCNANPKRAPSSRFFTLASDLSGLSCPREHAETDGPTVRSDVAQLPCLNRSRMSSRQHIGPLRPRSWAAPRLRRDKKITSPNNLSAHYSETRREI